MAYICVPYDDGSTVVSGTIRFTRKEYEKLKFLASSSNVSKGTVIGSLINQVYKSAVLGERKDENEKTDVH